MILEFYLFIFHSHSKANNKIHKCSYHPITRAKKVDADNTICFYENQTYNQRKKINKCSYHPIIRPKKVDANNLEIVLDGLKFSAYLQF